jgi:hypothetical protein
LCYAEMNGCIAITPGCIQILFRRRGKSNLLVTAILMLMLPF